MGQRSAIGKSLRLVLPLGGALLGGAFGVAAYTARTLNASTRRAAPDTFTFSPFELDVPHELVSFASGDGVTLRGWWFPRPESDQVVIGLAGHRRAKHELLGIGSGLWRAGKNVLLFDFRGCGESDWAPQSVGHNELLDAHAAVRFAVGRQPGAKIGLVGYSMGGAVALLVGATDPAVRAVVADSAYASLRQVIAHAYARRGIPGRPLLNLADAINRRAYGYSFTDLRPVDAIPLLAPRPVLLIHGTADKVTPMTHANELYEAAREPKELWLATGAAHCGAYFLDRARYVDRVGAFFDRMTAASRIAYA